MRWVLFLSRIAFICNLFSLLTIFILWKNIIGEQVIVSTIAILGYVMAILFNPLVNIIYTILLLTKRPTFSIIPKWLVVINFIFLLLQLQYIFFLNDTFYSS